MALTFLPDRSAMSNGKRIQKRGQRRDMTLDDVAKMAGVAPITASRALHKPELVSAKTVARVLEVVERIGYVPNLLAGALASQKSRLVAAVVPTLSGPMFLDKVQRDTH